MVLIHYKKTDHNQFLYQTTGNTIIADILQDIIELNNMRIQLDIFACSIEELATHGPLRPQEIRGLTDQELIDNALIISSQQKKQWGKTKKPVGDQRYNEDKTHYRTGIIKSQQLTQMLIETSVKAKKLISYKRAQDKQILVLKELYQMKEELKAALMIAYPNFEGLAEWEPARSVADGSFVFADINTDRFDYLDPKNSVMWWANKQFNREKPLNFYTGKNEKTKIIVKLTKTGSGAPGRQPAIDEKTKTEMMAKFHKKQEQLKKIESNNEEDFKNSSWANPNNLKNYLVGGGKQVSWKPK